MDKLTTLPGGGEPTILGLIIAAGVLLGIVGTLRWMMAPPISRRMRAFTEGVAEAVEQSIGNILVPTVGALYSDRMVDMACRIARERKTGISALHVVEVPRLLPPDAEMPELMERGTEALLRAQAIATRNGVPIETLTAKARDAGPEIVDVAKKEGVSMILLGVNQRRRPSDLPFGKTIEYVARHAPCEVMIEVPPEEPI